jgi:hypothetical protein
MDLLSRLLGGRRGGRGAARHLRPTLEALEDRTLPSGTSAIASNFNGTPIHAGDTVWFSSVVKVSGLGSAPATLHLVDSEIDFTANGTNYAMSVPNAVITFSPTATTAATTFDASSNTWDTTVPSHLGGNVFLAGVALPTPAGLPGGINPVTWKGTFQSDTAGLSVNWQWAAAVYTQFGTDYNALGVKPVDDNQASVYKNSDHAGTPENFRSSVTGGARGGGGSNFTGSLSATAQVQPDVLSASLSGVVFNEGTSTGLAGVVITLTGVNSLGQTVTLTTTTNASGAYSFTGLGAGTYTITESPPSGFQDDHNQVGSLGGTTGSNVFSGIALSGGASGVNYNFGNVFAGS